MALKLHPDDELLFRPFTPKSNALRNFKERKYPYPKPISTDFINELRLVIDVKCHPKIEEMFMEITDLYEKGLSKYD